MGFNKRFISKDSLKSIKSESLDYLIRHIKGPDCLFIEDDFSQKICDLVFKVKDKNSLKKKLVEIGYYES